MWGWMMGEPMNNSGPLQYREWCGLYSLLAGRTDAHLSVSHSLVAEAAGRLDSSVGLTCWKTLQVVYTCPPSAVEQCVKRTHQYARLHNGAVSSLWETDVLALNGEDKNSQVFCLTWQNKVRFYKLIVTYPPFTKRAVITTVAQIHS